MAAYNVCLQVSFILVQVLFVASGVVMIGVGAWLEVQERSIVAAVDSETFLAGPYLIIAAGCAVVLVAVIGLIGALCDKKINRFLLVFYIVLVLIVFAAQLTGGILGFVFRDDITNIIQDGLNSTLNDYNSVNSNTTTRVSAITESWDFVQENLDCCGLLAVEDWIESTGVFQNDGVFPVSCCITQSSQCNTNATDSTNIHANGCIQELTDFVREQLLIVASIAIAFVVGEIVVVLMAICLVCCTDFED